MNVLKRPSELKEGHPVRGYFDAYQDDALTEKETAAYRHHLATCQACRVWVNSHYRIAQGLSDEAPPPLTLSPAAAARIQQKIASRMRRALIVNNVRAAFGATMAIAVLALVVAIFVFQSRNLETLETTDAVSPASVASIELTEEGLIEAVRAKDSAAVERILEAGISPDTIDYDGDPILKSAIRRRGPRIVELLVAYGADVNITDSSGGALLPQAVRIGSLEMVQTLLKAGADINGAFIAPVMVLGNMEATGLYWAALDNRLEIARYLIAYGADVNKGDSQFNLTPLHGAAWMNNTKMITLLIESGADPNARSTYSGGATPLLFAIDSPSPSIETVQELLKGGADVGLELDSGMTPLMNAIQAGFSGVRERVTTLLLEAGADPNQQNNVGNTALHQAARWSRIDVIPILVEHGAFIEVRNSRGETPLDVAMDDRIIELLKELGAGQ